MLARAETMRAPLLLANEPTGQLDHANTVMVATALRHVADAGATVALEDAKVSYVDRS